jgi:hypothetical protein
MEGFMDQDLINKDLGDADLLLKLEDGLLKLTVKYIKGGVSGSVTVDVDSGYFLDKLAALIPGQIDDAVITVLKGALKA